MQTPKKSRQQRRAEARAVVKAVLTRSDRKRLRKMKKKSRSTYNQFVEMILTQAEKGLQNQTIDSK